jgi:3-oxoacyl-[acyl-carrier-protein] synthase-3
VRACIGSAERAMERAGVSPADIDVFVPHQANVRIIESAAQKIGIPMSKAAIVLDHTGNTSSASIPLALADAVDTGRVRDGDLVLLSGFGAGMTWASAVLRWGAR